MRIKDVPFSPAYLVFHDAFDNGAMEIWAIPSLEQAEKIASERNVRAENMGQDDCGVWKAYAKLPRVRVWKYHYPEQVPA